MMRNLYALLIILVFAVSGLGHATRADAEDVIIVLDASGSMWGQIDGQNKIVIAREVLADLLETTPADRRIGLVAYGHNRKGDCDDIEEISPVGTDRRMMIDAVSAISPKGKTPLSKAVMIAAEKLRYTEEKATVVLISDGIETCDLDPCEVANTLERLGVDFTAHVVGFDVADAEANRQLQCLAENTGGKFLSASNASELTQALEQTVAAPPPPSPPLPHLILRATELEGGPEVTDPLNWTIQQSGQGKLMLETVAANPETDIEPGTYDITAMRASDGATGSLVNVTIRPEVKISVTVPLIIPVKATVRAVPETAPAGSDVIVFWEGPDREGDYVSFARPEAETQYISYEYAKTGQPLKLRAPIEPGSYEIRYILANPFEVLARLPYEVTDVTAMLDAAETTTVGAAVPVGWTGPGYSDDFITIVTPDAAEAAYTSYGYARDGDSVNLTAPLEPGEYELRYILAGKRVIAHKAIRVEAVAAALEAPANTTAGSEVVVAWTGPDTDGDFITITEPDAAETRYTSYAYTKDGTQLGLKAPLTPGNYEFRYVQGGKKVIARSSLAVTEVGADIQAPSSAPVGGNIKVGWTGPDTDGDFITITEPDAGETRYTSYAYTRDGAEVDLVAPLKPGSYEYRYVQSGKKVIFRLPFEVIDATGTLDAPTSAGAGSSVKVIWTGPDNDRDFITITEPDEDDSRYTSYAYTKDGSPSSIVMPLDPGEYEFRYVMAGKRVLERKSVTVTAVTASIQAPATAAPDTEISVIWTGPDTNRDFITITKPDADEERYTGYAYTKDGSPAKFKTPAEPGTYEVRYVQGGKKVVARQKITVE